MNAKLIGTGSYLPKSSMSNDQIAELVETNDEWIQSRTGIKSRHISSGETTTQMAVKAAQQALSQASISSADLDLIIVATVSSDNLVPSTACLVQKELHAKNAIAFDINAACSGFIFASSIVDAYFKSGTYQTALVIGVETLSKIVDWKDRSCCILFGDGAGAAVFAATDASNTGILCCRQGSDGSRGEVLTCPNRPLVNPLVQQVNAVDHLTMDGQEVFKFAVKKVPAVITEALDISGLSLDSIDYFLLHQANIRIIQSIAKKLKVPMDKFPVNLDYCGNTSAASLPILLDECSKKGLLTPGKTILLAGFGAGLTWGCILLKF